MPAPSAAPVLSVADVLSEAAPTVRPDTTVKELLATFEAEHVDTVPVTDDNGVLVGVVAGLDVLRLLRPVDPVRLPHWAVAVSRPVEAIMRPGVITLEPTNPVTAAVDLLIETGFHAIPVVSRHSGPPVLVGVVRQRDLLRRLLAAGGRT
jgi:CBS-domain-containing membrane protein